MIRHRGGRSLVVTVYAGFSEPTASNATLHTAHAPKEHDSFSLAHALGHTSVLTKAYSDTDGMVGADAG